MWDGDEKVIVECVVDGIVGFDVVIVDLKIGIKDFFGD